MLFASPRRAFTIIELLITLTLFSTVAILCVNALVNAMASARKIQAQATLYSETQNLMDQLAREVEQNTVDYEAYYLRYGYSTPETGWETAGYGLYGQTFYNPGTGGNEAGPYSGMASYYGVACTTTSGSYPDACPTETPNYDYVDLDTGAHPFTGITSIDSGYDDDPTYMNAFCESETGTPDCSDLTNGVTDELILVNGAGDLRTVFSQVLFDGSTTDYHLSKVQLSGTDTDNDGIVNTWLCSTNFPCTGTVPDLTDFMPITPNVLDIESFTIYITPLEDPYRGFAEPDTQVQPTVTIVITATLSDDYSGRMLGDVPSLTIQRTISTGVYSKVESYE